MNSLINMCLNKSYSKVCTGIPLQHTLKQGDALGYTASRIQGDALGYTASRIQGNQEGVEVN
jgi:hypothetical protein